MHAVHPSTCMCLNRSLRRELSKNPRADESTWIVPGFGLESIEAAELRFAQPDAVRVISALQAQARGGGTVAACCSGVFLLREAGLLEGKRVTTTWWLGGMLQRLEPRCVVDVNQMIVADGRIITGGASFAHIDLMLHLLRTQINPSLARAVSRAMLIDGRDSQAQYIVPTALANGSDLAARVVARFEASLPKPPTVVELRRNCVCRVERCLVTSKKPLGAMFLHCFRAYEYTGRECSWRPKKCPLSK